MSSSTFLQKRGMSEKKVALIRSTPPFLLLASLITDKD